MKVHIQMTNAPPLPTNVEMNDLDTFIKALVPWHVGKVQLLEHMKQIPEGTEVAFDEEAPLTLQGDLLKGFQIGLAFALSELGTLPFTFELEDDEQEAAPAAAGVSPSSPLN